MALQKSYVIFDLGSTLIHFDGDWAMVFAEANQALRASLEDLGVGHFTDDFTQDFRSRMAAHHDRREQDYREAPTTAILAETLTAAGYADVPPDILQAAMDAMYQVSQAYWHLEEDAEAALQELREMGCRFGIFSNAGDDNDVQNLVQMNGLQDYFDYVLSSAGVGLRKPAPDVFEMSLAKWGAEPSQAIMVGDTLHQDILGAKHTGIHSVWITRRADRPDNMAYKGKIIPDTEIQALSELPRVVRDLG
jgi:2-haloalkanoic acid dehalogenase type II